MGTKNPVITWRTMIPSAGLGVFLPTTCGWIGTTGAWTFWCLGWGTTSYCAQILWNFRIFCVHLRKNVNDFFLFDIFHDLYLFNVFFVILLLGSFFFFLYSGSRRFFLCIWGVIATSFFFVCFLWGQPFFPFLCLVLLIFSVGFDLKFNNVMLMIWHSNDDVIL